MPDADQIDDSDFTLTDESSKKKRQATVREGQQRFQFAVFQRYGRHCAMCGITAPEVLDAAHLRPKAKKGSDHAGKGLVCPQDGRQVPAVAPGADAAIP